MVKEILEKNPDKNIIAILQGIQEKYGYISEEKAAEAAKQLNIPLGRMWGIVTFYSQFKLHKPGKYIIQVCNGTACHINNADGLIERLKEVLDIDIGETTEDGLFSIELVNCIGACARSPAIMINGKVYGQLLPKDIDLIINEYKNKK
jgi:NADH:ubiquinone oxidoreductase subunit E